MIKKVSKEQLREMIREALREQAKKINQKPDAKDPKASFGQYLFGPEQKNPKAQREENTDAEEDLGNALSSHFGGSTSNTNLGNELMKVVKPELQKGNYTDVLAPPKGTVYRGMMLKPGQFAKIVKMNVEDIKADPHKGWFVGTNGILKPPYGNKNLATMSWTVNPNTAASFAGGAGDVVDIGWEGERGGDVYAVFTANTTGKGNNFFINPKTSKKKYKPWMTLTEYPQEEEVISVGPVNFSGVSFYYDKYVEQKNDYDDEDQDWEERQRLTKQLIKPAVPILSTLTRKSLIPYLRWLEQKSIPAGQTLTPKKLHAYWTQSDVIARKKAEKLFSPWLSKALTAVNLKGNVAPYIIQELVWFYVNTVNRRAMQGVAVSEINKEIIKSFSSSSYIDNFLEDFGDGLVPEKVLKSHMKAKPKPEPMLGHLPLQSLLYALGVQAKKPKEIELDKYSDW